MAKKNIHTVFNKERKMWETKKEGQEKPIASSHTKEAAEEKSIREAKKAGVTLSGVETQSAKYTKGLPPGLPAWRKPLPFSFQSTGVETRFTSGLDPEPRSRIEHFLANTPLGFPILRDPDGLAMSSRNVYLCAQDRARAPALHRALAEAARRIAAGEVIGHVMGEAREAIATAGFDIDYVEARHAETLARIAQRDEGPVRLLAAARLGATRLIDNVAVPAA